MPTNGNQTGWQTWRERPRLPQTDSSVCSAPRYEIKLKQSSALPPGNASTNRAAANLEVHATSQLGTLNPPPKSSATIGKDLTIQALLTLFAALVCGATELAVQVEEPSLWMPVLPSVGLEATGEPRRFRIVVGDSPAGRELGFRPTAAKIRVAQVIESRAPVLHIFWQEPLELPLFDLTQNTKVFAREKHTGAPLVAGLNR